MVWWMKYDEDDFGLQPDWDFVIMKSVWTEFASCAIGSVKVLYQFSSIADTTPINITRD